MGNSVESKPLKTVKSVDMTRFVGKWYEQARKPNCFENELYAATATYTANSDGSIGIVNSGRLGSREGEVVTAEGRGKIVNTKTNAKLEVSFFFPFEAPYWIIELNPDYKYAVIGEPTRTYLWILSREEVMKPELLDRLLQIAEDKHGYDTGDVLRQ